MLKFKPFPLLALTEDPVKTVEFRVGTSIRSAAQQLIMACEPSSRVCGTFNGISLVADEDSSINSIVNDFNEKSTAATEVWRNSPEGIAAARQRKERLEQLQATYEAAMEELPTLDFDNPETLLDWFCKIQPATDHVGITGRVEKAKEIVRVFAEHGYHPNVNIGNAHKADDEDNVARFIIGQCLDLFGPGPEGTINQVAHYAVEDWKKKFRQQAA